MTHSPSLLRLFLVLSLALLCLGMEDNQGCVASESSEAVDQDRNHTSYWLYNDAEGDTTYGRAQFRLGNGLGTPLLLADGASVAFEGRLLGFDAVLDWYDAPRAGFFDGGDFVYMDLDGDTFVNTAPPLAPVEVPVDFPATVRRDGSSLEVAWEGAPLAVGESLAAIVAHDPNRFVFRRWETRLPGATSIVLTGDALRDLPTGATVLTLRRWWESAPAEAPGAGGVIRTTYSSREAAFVLE